METTMGKNGSGGNGAKAAQQSYPKPVSQVPSIEIPPLPPGVPDRRHERLFTEHPLKDKYLSTHRFELATVFHGYNVDGTSIICLADLKEVRQYLKGTNYQPV